MLEGSDGNLDLASCVNILILKKHFRGGDIARQCDRNMPILRINIANIVSKHIINESLSHLFVYSHTRTTQNCYRFT